MRIDFGLESVILPDHLGGPIASALEIQVEGAHGEDGRSARSAAVAERGRDRGPELQGTARPRGRVPADGPDPRSFKVGAERFLLLCALQHIRRRWRGAWRALYVWSGRLVTRGICARQSLHAPWLVNDVQFPLLLDCRSGSFTENESPHPERATPTVRGAWAAPVSPPRARARENLYGPEKKVESGAWHAAAARRKLARQRILLQPPRLDRREVLDQALLLLSDVDEDSPKEAQTLRGRVLEESQRPGDGSHPELCAYPRPRA